MASVFQSRRREPRVLMRSRFHVVGRCTSGQLFSRMAETYDLSPSGAGLLLDVPVPVDACLRISAMRYGFEALAIVRNCSPVAGSLSFLVGVEFLYGVKNPVVSWSTRH